MNKKIVIVLIIIVFILSVGAYFGYNWWNQKQWNNAEDYYRQGNYQKASEIMLKFSIPEDTEKLGIYAQTMFATSHLDKAEIAYQKLYEKEKDPFAKMMLGNIANQNKDYEKAKTVYKELIESNPNYIQAYVNLATIYRIQQDQKNAVSITEEGISKNANATVLYELLLSIVINEPTSESYQKAYKKLKEINPQSAVIKSADELNKNN
ncbi:hypothetical protein A2X44_01865 [candidate division CPR3 bacterium GWF2_35_18]|uniref:Uncharacterized protein n=1 Tax=candidate division CPR3 bacterium GW2011_GWF2_35_18 TaxID=1618350 RepID=A0A0G0ERG7_UNCC3|nr:MAG: hypothetical protein UR67_C0002G0057 [candidate division CPR3 bacterium GW2011_GWF2_35_18]KKP86291.1 MAG: hypothetical protein UR87_C0023G0005 [candidate division CPR3 bacterium GW2011_GWE2_35_7]OGB62746.1 MAG: hypothetical protein A2X44_01865 [candidate division CPR3 bacterium GWF2_35_18]OGB65772.1 MAG: hypothetical protein A2250_02125 [candidate division CPR3 bacterium RIFOXYA2_FULL_35_13]OGB75773.1 MAG: hypothetical protein A2476_03795 [candidate division CPR3 bacterium RIFOXYC2_FULL